ncbi:MAG: nucleotide exchange factor GrpE [Deltaproteobacteria bacterium]|nr:nucleotide exchange factor GrpE [Deltaproteobacteria bacterium]MBW2078160.1 nucleotide exchange factor GrpE [Deltaproteobacteria bacterium]MBW2312430.1 nucleotide exchange factor GrpE [Deltaproteobacteria bacterium]
MSKIEVKTSQEAEEREGESVGSSEKDTAKSKKSGKEERQKSIEEMTKQELIEKLKDVEQKSQENYDLYMRTYAEMENVKRRGAKEREELAKFANATLIKELLPVIDSLEKALSHAEDGSNPSGLAEGIKLTLNGLMDTLEKEGLEEVKAKGKPFDPNFHEAISQQADDTVPPKHVIMEMQKGYLLNGRLIRPSMVVISQGNGQKKDNEEDHA